MNKGQRPAGDVGNNPVSDALVIASELNLRNPEVGVDQPVGM
jgi:hypothetical protein